MKSNNQTGPGASFTVTKNNVFGGGEAWNVKLDGSYEWQTGKDRSSLMNSYEVGLSTSLMFPRVVFPRFGDKEYDFPATTTFKLYIDQLNRAKYYKLLAFGGNATYDFQPKRTSKHSLHRSNSRSTYFATLRKPSRSCRRRILHSTSACATSLFRSLSICTPTTTHLCRVCAILSGGRRQ